MSKRKKREQPYVEFPGTGIVIPVPDDPEQEDEAVAAALDDLVAAGKLKGRRERGPGISAQDLYEELGYSPPGHRNGAVPDAASASAPQHRARRKTSPSE